VSPTTWGWLVLGFPLAGTVAISLLWRRLPGRTAGIIGTSTIGLAFVAAVGAFVSIQGRVPAERTVTSTAYNYANTVGVDIKLTILIDPLAVWMMLIVTGVSALIHLYSISYMGSDRGYARFFAYLNYFVFSMLLLVEAGNFAILIVGWAGVGAASYLLISFWYRRGTATEAGIKAFVINVIGDAGLVLGTYFIFKHTGSLDFVKAFDKVPDVFAENDGDLVAGCILLLVGAFAKSAQIPLHTWLPDAMEGPTPVSALIHAATMVTAGVYLIARMWPLFEQAPAAADVGAILGCATVFVAATIALTMTDIKRVIAYSTMSQIGYMIMGVSSGAYAAGMFHLFTHAFFKALLFMAAGSIIAAMAGEQSLDRMSGFRRALPFTFAAFVLGGLALSAVPPFSGYFSKDEILTFVADRGGFHWVLYVVGYIAALLTAIYTFRMIFRAFFGEPCKEARELEEGHPAHAEPFNPQSGEREDTDVGFPGPEHHIAEREPTMRVPMVILGVGCIVNGLIWIPHVDDLVRKFLEPSFAASRYFNEVPANGLENVGLILSAAFGLLGVAIAYRIWVQRPGTAERIRARFAPVYELFVHKWWFDELYDVAVVRPMAATGRFFQRTFERVVVDGLLVGGTTTVVRAGSATVRGLQNGFLRYYAALLLVGVAGVSLYFLISSS
jgi:NADH-quinone oxidoreductase subunit L